MGSLLKALIVLVRILDSNLSTIGEVHIDILVYYICLPFIILLDKDPVFLMA